MLAKTLLQNPTEDFPLLIVQHSIRRSPLLYYFWLFEEDLRPIFKYIYTYVNPLIFCAQHRESVNRNGCCGLCSQVLEMMVCETIEEPGSL